MGVLRRGLVKNIWKRETGNKPLKELTNMPNSPTIANTPRKELWQPLPTSPEHLRRSSMISLDRRKTEKQQDLRAKLELFKTSKGLYSSRSTRSTRKKKSKLPEYPSTTGKRNPGVILLPL